MKPQDVDEVLAELAAEGQAQVPAPRPSDGPTIKRLRYSHQAMVDVIIQNPGISQGQLAVMFGYTQSWVSTVINSDAFQTMLAARRSELIDPEIVLTIKERFEAMTAQSLRIMQEKLSRPADSVSDDLVIEGLKIGAKALGLGAQQVAPPAPPADEHLRALADRILRLGGSLPQAPVDATVLREAA